jgi:hypothetical protein
LTCSLLVHVAEHVESNGHHGAAQGNKTVSRTKERPVASEEAAKERAFGNDEEQSSDCSYDMAAGVKEEKLPIVSLRNRRRGW